MEAAPNWREVDALITTTSSVEAALPDRIRYLRERVPLTHTELAARLAELGWRTDRTTLWKIENPSAGNGRRKIAIDELVALSRAFGVTVTELLLPEGAVAELSVWRAFQDATEALEEVRRQWAVYAGGVERVRTAVAESSGVRSRIADYLDAAEADRLRQIGDVWINDADDETERRTRAQLVAQDPRRLPAGVEDGYPPTPAIIAARHVLADDPIAPSILATISQRGA